MSVVSGEYRQGLLECTTCDNTERSRVSWVRHGARIFPGFIFRSVADHGDQLLGHIKCLIGSVLLNLIDMPCFSSPMWLGDAIFQK